MRNVRVAVALPCTPAEAAFEAVQQFERYPELSPVVRSVTVNDGSSDWEVYFRNGILRWTENDQPDPERLAIAFRQEDGDFDSFDGAWRILRRPDGSSVVDFRATFDFGIPSLAGILEPVAERVIKDTIAAVVTGLFAEDGAVVMDAADLPDAVKASVGTDTPAAVGAAP